MMQILQFKITINARPQIVWNCLWELENYKKWATFFCKGSYFETTELKEGNKIQFLLPNGEGMYSTIEEMKVNEKIVFRHLGEIKNFEEQYQSWNAIESYELNFTENTTELTVKAETLQDYIDFMNKTFPLALQELKKLSENESINNSN